MEEKTSKKCYNSWSCILSVLIIAFVLGSIIYDFTVSKPQMRKNISEIKVEIQQINEKIEAQLTASYVDEAAKTDTIIK